MRSILISEFCSKITTTTTLAYFVFHCMILLYIYLQIIQIFLEQNIQIKFVNWQVAIACVFSCWLSFFFKTCLLKNTYVIAGESENYHIILSMMHESLMNKILEHL
jgi:hypothetical protein